MKYFQKKQMETFYNGMLVQPDVLTAKYCLAFFKMNERLV